jgi:hypothetical protein
MSMKKKTLNFRVSAEFKRKLVEKAAKERRSLTNYIEVALNQLWELEDSEPEVKAATSRRIESRQER